MKGLEKHFIDVMQEDQQRLEEVQRQKEALLKEEAELTHRLAALQDVEKRFGKELADEVPQISTTDEALRAKQPKMVRKGKKKIVVIGRGFRRDPILNAILEHLEYNPGGVSGTAIRKYIQENCEKLGIEDLVLTSPNLASDLQRLKTRKKIRFKKTGPRTHDGVWILAKVARKKKAPTTTNDLQEALLQLMKDDGPMTNQELREKMPGGSSLDSSQLSKILSKMRADGIISKLPANGGSHYPTWGPAN